MTGARSIGVDEILLTRHLPKTTISGKEPDSDDEIGGIARGATRRKHLAWPSRARSLTPEEDEGGVAPVIGDRVEARRTSFQLGGVQIQYKTGEDPCAR